MPHHGDLECEWRIVDGCHACKICGWVYASKGKCLTPPVLPLRRLCPAKARTASLWGWGDHLALFLEALGITDARVTWLGRLLRLLPPDGPCGCEERKARLNLWGYHTLAWLRARRWVR